MLHMIFVRNIYTYNNHYANNSYTYQNTFWQLVHVNGKKSTMKSDQLLIIYKQDFVLGVNIHSSIAPTVCLMQSYVQ